MTATVTPPAAVGDVVLYNLTEADAYTINRQHGPANEARAGQSYPALVVRTWGDTPGSAVQLQVLYDGAGSYWATSRLPGFAPGQWRPRP